MIKTLGEETKYIPWRWERKLLILVPPSEIGFWGLMDDKLKCNIIPELWGTGVLGADAILFPKLLALPACSCHLMVLRCFGP